jgi:conjugative transfer signal peptidase TraF
MRAAWRTFAAMLVTVSLVALTAAINPSPMLLWNASGSVPIGLYAVRPTGRLSVAELVVARPPEPLASFMDRRAYLPLGVPLLKRVVALPGQRICRTHRTITVDSAVMGVALDRDRRGRGLPAWAGCRVIRPREVFLMNVGSGDSLDGRYFGPLPASAIIGCAVPLWIERQR